MTLRLHESMINNLAFDALAGRTVYEEKVQATAIDLLGHLPEKMKGDEDGRPWAITFAPRQPISVTFADNGFQITLRGVKYYKGDEAYPAMNVSASYKFEKSPEGFKLVRQGPIEVASARRGRPIAVGRRYPRTLEEAVREGVRARNTGQGDGTVRPLESGGQARAGGTHRPRRLADDRLESPARVEARRRRGRGGGELAE